MHPSINQYHFTPPNAGAGREDRMFSRLSPQEKQRYKEAVQNSLLQN
jgi:hypothetical protein